MINFNSIKNKIIYAIIPFPPVIYADEGEANTTTDKLQLGVGGDFKNLTTITPKNFISGTISLALTITTIVFFLILLTGGYRWIVSSGDEKKLTTARGQITHGLVGLIIIFSSWVILKVIELLFGINILQLNIPSFLNPNPTNPV